MDVDSSAKFIGSLTKFLQSLCNGYVEFQRGVELVGHIYLSIDTGEKVDYILHEKVSKNDENSVTFVSNSFHAQPQDKEKTKDTPSKPDAKGSSDRLSSDEDDDIMIVDHSQGSVGSTNSGSVVSRGVKRMASPGSDHRHGQRVRPSAGQSLSQNQTSSGHSFTSLNRHHSGRPSATVTSQGGAQNENLNISEVKLEQISRDELLSLASQVGEGGTGPPHSSSSASRSQPPHLAMAAGGSRGDAAMWVKQEVTDDGGGGTDAGWSQERDDSNSNSGSNLYPVMLHQNPAAFSSSTIPGFSSLSGSGNQSAANPFPMPGTSQDMSGLDPSERMGWTRRIRTSFTQSQIRTLEREFVQGQYLTRPRRCFLAKKLNLTERHITIWFQNRRQKLKKEQHQTAGEKDFSRPPQFPSQPLWPPGPGLKDFSSRPSPSAQFHMPQSPDVQDLSKHNQSPGGQLRLYQSPGSQDLGRYGQSPNQFQLPPSPGGVQDLSRPGQSPFQSPLSHSPSMKDANRYSQSPSQSQPSQSPGVKDLSLHSQSPSQASLSHSPGFKDAYSHHPPSNPSPRSQSPCGKDTAGPGRSPDQSLPSQSPASVDLNSGSQSSGQCQQSQSPVDREFPCSFSQSPNQRPVSESPGGKDLGSNHQSPRQFLMSRSPGASSDSSRGPSPGQSVLPHSQGGKE